MNSTIDGVRSGDLRQMVEKLTAQQATKLDLVVPAAKLRTRDAQVIVAGQDLHMDENGVTDINGAYRMSDIAIAQVAERAGIPVKYLRKLVDTRTDLADANVNGLFGGKSIRRADGTKDEIHPADGRNFLLRLFRAHDEQAGLVRAVLSDKFGIIDHLDVTTAVLEGIRSAGAEVEFHSCNLNDSNMSVSVLSPQVNALAPKFLEGYRNPFANPKLEEARQSIQSWWQTAAGEGMDYLAGEEPIVFAGFQFGNSEVGSGKFYLQPKLMIKVCRNGLTLPAFAVSKVHLGAKLGEGTVRWSRETLAKARDLITSQAKDAVTE
jgi:hypothetical protein